MEEEQQTALMLLNIIGSILDSDSRRIGSNPVGAKFQQGIRGTSAVRNPSKVEQARAALVGCSIFNANVAHQQCANLPGWIKWGQHPSFAPFISQLHENKGRWWSPKNVLGWAGGTSDPGNNGAYPRIANPLCGYQTRQKPHSWVWLKRTQVTLENQILPNFAQNLVDGACP